MAMRYWAGDKEVSVLFRVFVMDVPALLQWRMQVLIVYSKLCRIADRTI